MLAALACGLQITFWENATSGTGEMFDLLLFAYMIRCLLEYRVSGRTSWLARFAFVNGLGTADDWAMGRSMAIWMAEKLHGKGNVVLLSGIAGASPAELRAAAAMEAMAREGRYPSGSYLPALSRGFAAFERGDFSEAIAALAQRMTIVSLPARLWTCGGPEIAEAVERLAAAARAREATQ